MESVEQPRRVPPRMVHALLGIADGESPLAHPVVGASWEGLAIEIKRGLAPKVERGFHHAGEAVLPERRLVVYGGTERVPLAADVEAVSLIELCEDLAGA